MPRRVALALSIFAGAVAALALGASAQQPARTSLYAAVGAELIRFDVDVAAAVLTRRESVMLPAHVQEAAFDPSGRFLYVGSSDGGASHVAPGAGGGPSGTDHRLTAFRVDPASGVLQQHGPAVPLPSRPIHVTTDRTGRYVLAAYNDPSGVTVHRLRENGAIGEVVPPAAPLDAGIYGHQIRVTPSNRTAILVTRGNGPAGTRPEDPGALKVFGFDHGVLSPRASIAPAGGYGFQARHVDFHPSKPWLFVSVERQNTLQMYRVDGDAVGTLPVFTTSTLANSDATGQTTSAIRVHPNGRVVYVGNRARTMSGDNSIAVFRIDQETGEPALIQNAATHGIYPRTFALDRAGRVLVAGNQATGLSVFRVQDAGTLAFSRSYPMDVSTTRNLFWVGMAP
jgi:6-phosphogluconolactonase (cycloisomerase 2 family)